MQSPRAKQVSFAYMLSLMLMFEVMETCLRIHIINVFGLIRLISVDIGTQDTSNVFSM